MIIQPEIDAAGVVVLGDFTPAVFTPAWFARHGLLSESAADSANLEIASPTLTRFSTDWLSFHATVHRFDVHTAQAPHRRVCDLVVWSEVLGLELRVVERGLRFYDPRTGEELPDLTGTEDKRKEAEARAKLEAAGRRREAAARQVAEARVQKEVAARQAAEARLAELEALLHRGPDREKK